jgi:hypothetical protein
MEVGRTVSAEGASERTADFQGLAQLFFEFSAIYLSKGVF